MALFEVMLSANFTVCASDVGRSILMCEFKKKNPISSLLKKGSLPWGEGISIEIRRFNWLFQLISDFLRASDQYYCIA